MYHYFANFGYSLSAYPYRYLKTLSLLYNYTAVINKNCYKMSEYRLHVSSAEAVAPHAIVPSTAKSEWNPMAKSWQILPISSRVSSRIIMRHVIFCFEFILNNLNLIIFNLCPLVSFLHTERIVVSSHQLRWISVIYYIERNTLEVDGRVVNIVLKTLRKGIFA